jgi:hypothetical protein
MPKAELFVERGNGTDPVTVFGLLLDTSVGEILEADSKPHLWNVLYVIVFAKQTQFKNKSIKTNSYLKFGVHFVTHAQGLYDV